MRTNEEILAWDKNREKRLAESPKNIKCPGTLRKLRRKIRNEEKNA